MAITIDWGSKVISVPKDFSTLVQSTPTEIRTLDLNAFRLALKDLEDSEEGMMFPDTHRHNTEVSVSGITLARVIEIINGYTITFEDGQYAINLTGANSNVGDVVNVNQVSVRVSNSAGLTSAPAIEYASFEGGVWIDATSDTIGTVWPAGTPLRPVNNLDDAVLIAGARGFKKLYFIGDFTFGPSVYISNYAIHGEGLQESQFTFQDGCILAYCSFKDCYMTGIIVGVIGFENCHVNNLSSSGLVPSSNNLILKQCLLEGTLGIPSNYTGTIFALNCWSASTGVLPPVLDMHGAHSHIICRQYNGGIQLNNYSWADGKVVFNFVSGRCILDSTVTDGNVQLKGIASLTDNSGPSANVDDEGLVNVTQIGVGVWDEPLVSHTNAETTGYAMVQLAYGGKVYINTATGEAGTAYPTGIRERPVNNIADALTLCENYGVQTIHVMGSLTLSGGDILYGITFTSDRSIGNTVIITDAVTTNSYYDNLTISGTFNGRTRLTYCSVGTCSDFNGGMRWCGLTGNVHFEQGNPLLNYLSGTDTFVTESGDINYRTLDVGDANVNLINSQGSYKIINNTGTEPTYAGMNSGNIWVDASCTEGTISIEGLCNVIDEHTGTCVVTTDATISRAEILDVVWNTLTLEVSGAGTTGRALIDAGSAGNPWSSQTALNNDIGTFGAFIQTLLTAESEGELASVPDVDANLAEQIQFLYQYFRNKRTVTGTTETMYKIDGTPISTSNLADDGTTFTKDKMV